MADRVSPRVPAQKTPRPLSGLTGIAQEVFLEVARTAEALKQDIDELLKQSALSATQYNVLRILRGAGTAGLTCQEIIERMVTRDPDMTRLLDRLEERALVVRARSREDRRVVRSSLTAGGSRLVEDLDAPIAELHQRQLGHLGEERLRALADSLRVIRETLAANRVR